MEKPAKKVTVWALVWPLLLGAVVVALLFWWAMYERSANTENKQSLAVVSGEISKLKKEVATCLAMNKEKELKEVTQTLSPCEKPKKKIVRPSQIKKQVAKPAIVAPAPVLVPAQKVMTKAPVVVPQNHEVYVQEPKDDFYERAVYPKVVTVEEEKVLYDEPPVEKKRSRRIVIVEQPQYYDSGYSTGYIQPYPRYQYQQYPQYVPAPVYSQPYVPPPRQVFVPAPHVIVPAPSSYTPPPVVQPSRHGPTGVTTGHSPSGVTGPAH